MADIYAKSGHTVVVEIESDEISVTLHEPSTTRRLGLVESLEQRRALALPPGRKLWNSFGKSIWAVG